MRFRNTLIVASIIAAIGVYAYFIEHKGENKRKERKERAERLFKDLDKEKIQKIKITFGPQVNEKGVKVKDKIRADFELEKKGEDWTIISPKESRAEKSRVSSLLSGLERVKSETPIAVEGALTFDKFGLEPAEVEILISTSDSKNFKLMLGWDITMSAQSYARVEGRNEILIIDKSIRTAVDTNLDDFKDKSFLAIKTLDIQKFQVSGEGIPSYELVKTNDKWNFSKPFEIPVNQSEWSVWFNEVTRAKAAEISYDGVVGATQKAKYGLNRPALKVVMTDKDSKPMGTIIFGRVIEDPKKAGFHELYGYVEGSSVVGKLGQGMWAKLDKKAGDLMLEKPITQLKSEVAQVKLSEGKKVWTFTKDAQTNQWALKKEDGSSPEVNGPRVDELVAGLWELKAEKEKWKASPTKSLANSQWKVEFSKRKAEAFEPMFSISVGARDGVWRLTHFSQVPGALAVVSADSLDKAKGKWEDYLVKPPAAAESSAEANSKKGSKTMLEPTVKDKKEIKKLDKAFVDPKKKYTAEFDTAKGKFTLEFYAKQAPYTVSNFLNLARNKYYDGLKFHRVIKDFMAQGGDPTGTGSGGPGYQFQDEFSDKTHERGTLSMANAGPNTNGSQFFICFQPQPHLNGKHSVFGKVTGDGMKVVDQLSNGDVMKTVKVFEE